MPTTRPYADCLAQALALCGVPDSNAVEVARIGILLNRRAKQAYAESEDWPRWLVTGEERRVSEDGLLPYEQIGFRDIGTIKRIHDAAPFKRTPAGEYTDWVAQGDGVQITNFSGPAIASMNVSGSLSPDATGDYLNVGTEFAGEETGKPIYRFGSLTLEQYPAGAIIWNNTVWQLFWFESESAVSLWNSFEDVATPDLVTTWTPVVNAVGQPTVTPTDLYTAFVTYKLPLSVTYGTGDGEESDVPEEWFEFMATGGAGDFLCSDKETENGLLLKDEAQTDLDRQLAKISRQNGSKAATRVLTHGGMQAR